MTLRKIAPFTLKKSDDAVVTNVQNSLSDDVDTSNANFNEIESRLAAMERYTAFNSTRIICSSSPVVAATADAYGTMPTGAVTTPRYQSLFSNISDTRWKVKRFGMRWETNQTANSDTNYFGVEIYADNPVAGSNTNLIYRGSTKTTSTSAYPYKFMDVNLIDKTGYGTPDIVYLHDNNLSSVTASAVPAARDCTIIQQYDTLYAVFYRTGSNTLYIFNASFVVWYEPVI